MAEFDHVRKPLPKRFVKFPNITTNVITATKGLPCTAKSAICKLVSIWAKCPQFSMDDFLDTLSMEEGYSAKSPPSPEEADRLHRLACEALLKVAHRKLKVPPFLVVLKTRLFYSFELDMLLRLADSFPSPSLVIIVECNMRNEFQYQKRLEHFVVKYGHDEWYKARTWKDIENMRDEIDDDRAWDDHVRASVDHKGKSPFVIKLLVDTYNDLNTYTSIYETASTTLLDAINYLILRGDQAAKGSEFLLGYEDAHDSSEDKELSDEEVGLELDKSSYAVVQYENLQRYLFKMKLKASKYKEKSKNFCPTQGGDCVFKFLVDLPNDEKKINCGVCEDLVHGSQPAYTCYFCVLTMHETCAKFLNMEALHQLVAYSPNQRPWMKYKEKLQDQNSSMDIFNRHLKGKMLPTIIKHDAHKHVLSIQLLEKITHCQACGRLFAPSSYVCHICNFYYELDCVFLPYQVMHKHGGYEHLMKLTYSHLEQEEFYWCDRCYYEIDPQSWFYCCQECPYYVTHISCFGLP